MELDEIKNIWSDLNKRMEDTEQINRRILTTMLDSRRQSAKDKLMKYEQLFLVICIVFTLFNVGIYFTGVFKLSTSILFTTIFIVAGLWQVYKIYLLNQMRVESCTTAELIQKGIRFKVITRMRTVVGLILVIPIFVLLFMLDPTLAKPETVTGMIVGGSIGLTIGLVMFFKNLRDIDALLKSYKEIDAFEKE